jgi:hypothetical protein
MFLFSFFTTSYFAYGLGDLVLEFLVTDGFSCESFS